MKKEEFPTFLNEQPTVVFGRTTRELLIIAIGLSCGYLVWQDVTAPAVIGPVVLNILKVACGLVPVALALVVAFIKVATRPLEEWAVIGFSYLVLPKVYLALPNDEESELEREKIAEAGLLNAGPLAEEDSDHYN